MPIQTTNPTSDITDRAARQLGSVNVSDNYQDIFLPLIFMELRRIVLLLAQMGDLDVEIDEAFLGRFDNTEE